MLPKKYIKSINLFLAQQNTNIYFVALILGVFNMLLALRPVIVGLLQASGFSRDVYD